MTHRDPESHKGDNGKVMIVGGNALFHGAPILCALGAEVSGVDLVYPFLPPIHADTARSYSLNFILHTFEKNILTSSDVKNILNFSQKMDAVIIGPGLGTDPKTIKAVKEILKHLEVPTVVDASALIYSNTLPPVTVLTPHQGEFAKMTGNEPSKEFVQTWAKHFKATIVVKGHVDVISDGTHVALNETGNSLMTVGGTGDVLAGLIGGLLAQGFEPYEAAKLGTQIIGKAGDTLAETQGSLRAIDLIPVIQHLLLEHL